MGSRRVSGGLDAQRFQVALLDDCFAGADFACVCARCANWVPGLYGAATAGRQGRCASRCSRSERSLADASVSQSTETARGWSTPCNDQLQRGSGRIRFGMIRSLCMTLTSFIRACCCSMVAL
eukprot:8203891-Pyramimonas_sp.AAC.1